tara:strand:+ start:1893 stop:2459 length:567 start_codon:yes stop_codon:yes gene_type:complete
MGGELVAIGTHEFTENGSKPFHFIQSKTPSSSVTFPIADTNQAGMVLVEGLVMPSAVSYLRVQLKTSTGTLGQQCHYRTWAKGDSGFSRNSGNSNYFEINGDKVDNNGDYITFQIWISLDMVYSHPFKDCMFHYRSINHTASLSNQAASSSKGMGKIEVLGEITRATILMDSGNINEHRIRCYNFFGN